MHESLNRQSAALNSLRLRLNLGPQGIGRRLATFAQLAEAPDVRIPGAVGTKRKRSGVLPAKKVGSKYIIAKKSVIAFVCAEDKNDRQISG